MFRGMFERVRIMLRFKILASTIPLVLAAIFAGGGLTPAHQPCIAIGGSSVQLATAPWQAQSYVAFTDDPARATVRVQIVDTPETADFAIADDIDNAAETGCGVQAATRLIGIANVGSSSEPVIYLSRDIEPDYRIYVHSTRVTPRDAAALIVGANNGHRRIAAAAL